jgi:hypothetical protein
MTARPTDFAPRIAHLEQDVVADPATDKETIAP